MLAAEIESTQFEKLRQSPFASELSDEQCHDLAAILETTVLQPGEILLREGELSDHLHIVVSGALEVLKLIGSEQECVSHINPGGVAGAMGFVGGEEHSATLRSQGTTELLSLHRATFEGLLNTNPVLVYRVMRTLFRTVHGIVRTMNNHYVQLTSYIMKQGGRY